MSKWTDEQLRRLDQAVAEAAGWTGVHLQEEFEVVCTWQGVQETVQGQRLIGWDPGESPTAGLECVVPRYSLGCKETFNLIEEANIELLSPLVLSPLDSEEDWDARAFGALESSLAPTPAISICLAYLAFKGKEFVA